MASFRKINYFIDKVCAPIIREVGQVKYTIWKYWPEIIGSEIASYAFFHKIVYNHNDQLYTLYINVQNSSIATIVNYNQTLIIRRISDYFGYQLISRIKIIHAH